MSKHSEFNEYKICGDYTILYIHMENQKDHEVLIDTEDLERVKELNVKWCAAWNKRSNVYYYRCSKYVGKSENLKSGYKNYYLHRWIMNAKKNEYVDHKDHNTKDNRKSNLRITNNSKNNMNRNGANKNNNTGVRNVSYMKNDNVYWVQFMKEGERYKWVFSSDEFKEACEFAEKKRKELFGEFAGNSIRK